VPGYAASKGAIASLLKAFCKCSFLNFWPNIYILFKSLSPQLLDIKLSIIKYMYRSVFIKLYYNNKDLWLNTFIKNISLNSLFQIL
jgi:hypothetical protein